MKLVSSRDFNQDVSRAKRAARIEPVFITDRGKPTHVLMSIEAFRQFAGQRETLVDLLAMPDPVDVEVGALDTGGAWGRSGNMD